MPNPFRKWQNWHPLRLWIDNTGLHSAGLCLYGKARARIDVDGLLQLATFIAFSDKILVNGFELESVHNMSLDIRSELICLGLNKECLNFANETEASFALACQIAAEDAAIDLPDAFNPIESNLVGLAPADLPQRLRLAQGDIKRIFKNGFSGTEVNYFGKQKLDNKAADAIPYMLLISPSLRKAIKLYFSEHPGLSPNKIDQLNAYLRYYLNNVLASENSARYAPAISRARILRQDHDEVIHRLDGVMDTVEAQLGFKNLGIPAVSRMLMERARGDPRGVITESIALREKTTYLRNWLSYRISRLERNSPNAAPDLDLITKDLLVTLKTELGILKKPRLRDAIEVLFILGIPAPNVKGSKLLEWLEHRLKRRKIIVLSELCHNAAPRRTLDINYRKLLRLSQIKTARS